MLNFGRLVAIIAVFHIAAPLCAQTVSNTHRTFGDATVGADWDDAYRDTVRAAGATWESGVAFGFDAGRSGVEVDVGVPQWHVNSGLPQRYHYVGPSFGYEQQGHLYESSWTDRRRSIDVTVMHRANVMINRRAAFAWLIGGGFVYRPDQSTVVTKEVLPDGQLTVVNTTTSKSDRNYLAAATRFDVEFTVTPRVSVVPRLRITAFPSLLDDSGQAPRMLVARPEIAVRWRF